MPPFILASQSPRRKQLLEQIHYSFSIETSTAKEIIKKGLPPADIVEQLARQKAENVWERHKDAVVLGADTIVAYGHTILGKPSNEDEAKAMLRLLSGQVHEVYTGVALFTTEGIVTFHDKTTVEFYRLTEEEIAMYIKSGEPFDKAGAYGIQGFGAFLVKRIDGDYFTVVGLPLAKTMRALIHAGIRPSF